MRLWHIDLIKNDLLPKSQLIAQWRELNSIFEKQNKHILINYVYCYDKVYLFNYSLEVIASLGRQNIKITEKSKERFKNYFIDLENIVYPIDKCNYIYPEHNYEYLTICYYNLKEKFIRKQKDFNSEIWNKLNDFYCKTLKEK